MFPICLGGYFFAHKQFKNTVSQNFPSFKTLMYSGDMVGQFEETKT